MSKLYPAVQAAFGFAACLSSSLVAFAAETPAVETAESETMPSTNLPPIVVSASREDLTARQMPAQVQVITQREISDAGYTSAKDVLEKAGGIFARTLNGNPILSQLSMRGFGENSFGRVLVLLNGVRINNPDMAAPNLSRIPVSAINRVEIIHGPQTVLHGDNAVGGVINIITDDTTVEPKTVISGMIGSYDTYAAHIGTTGGWADEGITWRGNGDWEKSRGYRDNGDYELWNANAAIRKAWGENRYLGFGAEYNHSDYGLPGSLSEGEMRRDRRQTNNPDDRAKQESWTGRMEGEVKVGEDGVLHLDAFANERKVRSNWLGADWNSLYNSTIDSFGVLPRYKLETPIAGFENRFTGGLDFYYDTTKFDSDYVYLSRWYSSWSLYSWDFDRASLAAYLHDEFFLTDELSIVAGVRGAWSESRVKSREGVDESDTVSDVAYELAMIYRPTENSKTYIRGSRFYHLPFIDEIFAGSGEPNFSLDPESGYSLDVGGDVELAREWTAGASLYIMWMEDEIYYNPYTYQNLNAPSKSQREGIELRAGWSREKVGSVGLLYNYTIAEFTDGAYEDKDIPLVPQHTVTLNGELYVLNDLSCFAHVRAVSDQVLGSDFLNEGNKIHAYGLLDLGVRYEPHYEVVKGLKLLCGVDNVFDKEYCDYAGYSPASAYSAASSYYYPAAGRFWKVAISYEF